MPGKPRSKINSARGLSEEESNTRNKIQESGNYRTNFSGVNKTSAVVKASESASGKYPIVRCASGTNLKLKIITQNSSNGRQSVGAFRAASGHGPNESTDLAK